MHADDARLLRDLMTGQRLLALGVLVDGAPYVGLTPFVPDARGAALVVHVSSLARHTAGLTPGAAWSGLIHAPDRPDLDPLQVPRVTLVGVVRPLAEGTAAHAAARAAYLARFPDSAVTFELGDFQLLALELREGRVIGGFARARDVTARELAQALRG
ncbi:MAG TPA: hypothetical protein VGQ83_15090 [Polyangia bacterium]|jgi:hypothetical protein